jgi:hypothetical protein
MKCTSLIFIDMSYMYKQFSPARSLVATSKTGNKMYGAVSHEATATLWVNSNAFPSGSLAKMAGRPDLLSV